MKTATKAKHKQIVSSSRREQLRRNPKEVVAELTTLRNKVDEYHDWQVQNVLSDYYKLKTKSRA